MAQSITNTVQNPFNSLFSGLVKPPPVKQGYLGGPSTPASPFTSGNTLGQLSTGPSKPVAGLVVPPKAPSWQGDLASVQNSFFNANPSVPRNPGLQKPNVQNTALAGNPAIVGGAVIPQVPAGTPAPQPVTPTQTSAPSTQGLFPNVLSSLAYGSADKNAALGKNAQDIAAHYGQQIADVVGQGSRFEAGQLTTGTSPVAEGNAAVTAQTTSAQQTALAQGEAAALMGNQQAITAQGQTQSALSSAGGLAQPQVTSFGQTSFNPITSQFDGGGSLPPEVMQQYAQMAVNGNYTAIPSFITGNPVLNAQLNTAAKALNPNFSPVQATGASGVLGGIPQLTSANNAAEGIKNTITSYLQANPTLNPSDLAAGNILQQWIQGKQLTDPKYQTLFNYLNEYTSTLAPILGVGGSPTDMKTQIAQGFINAAASGQSIAQVLSAMSQLATHKIQDLQSGAVGGSTPSTTTGVAPSTGGFAETW